LRNFKETSIETTNVGEILTYIRLSTIIMIINKTRFNQHTLIICVEGEKRARD